MELAQLLDLGMTGLLTAAVVGLWRDNQQQKQFLQGLLRGQLDMNDQQWRAARERRKIGNAVGLETLDDTEGKRPPGFDERLKNTQV